MPIELRIPEVGESVTEVEIGDWLKNAGDPVRKDEPVVTLESEKATVELPAPDSGRLGQILKQKGEMAKVGEVIGYLETGKEASGKGGVDAGEAKAAVAQPKVTADGGKAETRVMPAAQMALEEHGLRAEQVQASGPGGRLLKEDVLRHVEAQKGKDANPPVASAPTAAAASPKPAEPAEPATPGRASSGAPHREEEIVPMSRLRRTVAERLVEAQHTAALLTTFNEIDMSNTMALRKEHGEAFQQRYGVKLGFMSFFVKACIDALKQFPALNAEIRGTNVVYHNFYDVGVAVGSGKGLVVPVLRNAERMSFAEIEVTIGDFGRRAKENKLKLEELQGGTFTISNGGVYGSLLSTPIVNPPQSGVLGMHSIQQRPVAVNDAVVIRPMMYVALTYDHRLVDGREAVSCLRRIKEVIENPARMLIEV
jgi:2-oxoglutarate dehydrogenase E2 component (dihydrolipoamide succinyltransferase)